MDLKNIFLFSTFKIYSTIICSLCLLYQTSLIVEQYLKFNSVINIKFTPNVINSLPAITICYNRLYSFEKLVHRYPQYQDIYHNYTKFFNQFQYYYSKESEKENFTKFLDQEVGIYFKKYYEIINEKELYNLYDRNGVNFQDVFYNLTLSYQSAKVNKYFVTISGQISSLDGFNELLNDHDNKLFSYNFPPIESVSFAEEVKCFTFFSASQIPYKNYQAKLSSIKINKDFPKNWFPYDRENKMMIAIHSPLVIPARSSFFLNRTKNRKHYLYFKN